MHQVRNVEFALFVPIISDPNPHIQDGLCHCVFFFCWSIDFLIDSATSIDVEEHLYNLANELGITVITSSQVCGFPSRLRRLLIFFNILVLLTFFLFSMNSRFHVSFASLPDILDLLCSTL